MKKPIRILHLEDSPNDAALILAALEIESFECEVLHVKDRESFESAITRNSFDLILSDYGIPHYDGFAALKFAREKQSAVPFILLSGTLGEDQAVESLKNGATDYIIKGRLTRLVPAIRRALADAEEVAEHKNAEQRIREQAALLDKAQDAICLNDMSQQILYWNKSAERLYGWTAEEAIGRNSNDLLFQGDLTMPMKAVLNLIREGEWKGELNQVSKRGQKLVIESRWTLMRDEGGEPKSILVINTDITEKKQTEAKLLRTQRMESIGALAGGIAHDLNNSLAPILMAADLIRDELTTEDGKQLLDTMRNSAQRGADMVRQILSFSRGLTGEHAVLQLRHLISDMEKFARSTFPPSIQVRAQISGSLFPIVGDATQIHQVLMNLCINARDAMPSGGQLLLEANNANPDGHPKRQVEGPHVLLQVTDSGQGIPSNVMSKIFEPFFTTKEVDKGTGLGLSTVMEIVKSHRGFVDVSSELGKGTIFQVYLPATATGTESDAKIEDLPPAGTGQLILLVDDETALLEMAKLILEAHNFRVLTAKDGIEAVACFARYHREIEIVITDMMMPKMNGPDLAGKLKEINPKIILIGTSGLGSDEIMGNAGKANFHAFLKKPFSTQSLLAKLNEFLGKS